MKWTRIREAETRSIEKKCVYFILFFLVSFFCWVKFDPNHTLTLQNFYIYKYTLAAAVRVCPFFLILYIFFVYSIMHTKNVFAWLPQKYCIVVGSSCACLSVCISDCLTVWLSGRTQLTSAAYVALFWHHYCQHIR